MKKLSSFLVLMLIALMLFVSCNGSTPTKEESNSSSTDSSNNNSNDNTSTVTERDATDADVELANKVFAAVGFIQSILTDENTSNDPANATIDPATNTILFTGNGCNINIRMTENESYSVNLIGSATIEEVDENTDKYICNFTEGTVIADEPHTIKATLTLTSETVNEVTTKHFEVQEAFIDGTKVNNNKLAEKLTATFNSQSV